MLDAFESIRSRHHDDSAPEVLALDSIPFVAKRTMKKFCIKAFNEIYTTALNEGLVRKQDVATLVGPDVMRVLDSRKSNPSPAKCVVILEHISKQVPEDASEGNKRWRHANPRPREEPTPQSL